MGYGIDSIRVDGNDVFAVYNATKAAREHALKHNKPILIEAMTYRVGHHSTSDDSSAYRSREEVEGWATKDNPIVRFRKHLESKKLWGAEAESEFRKEARRNIIEAFSKAEKRRKPAIAELFTDVYDKPTPRLLEQQQEMLDHIKKYPEVSFFFFLNGFFCISHASYIELSHGRPRSRDSAKPAQPAQKVPLEGFCSIRCKEKYILRRETDAEA